MSESTEVERLTELVEVVERGDCTQCGTPGVQCNVSRRCEVCRATGGCTHAPAPVPSGGRS